jgi:hypothetical protein
VIEQLAALIVDEGKWLTLSMGVGVVAVTVLLLRQRGSPAPVHRRITAALNLGAGLLIAGMASGHLLAVLTKLALGTLREGSLIGFFAIGLVLLVPAWLVTRHTRTALESEANSRTLWLNGWLAATLLALGLHNLPLAAPALFTMAYRLHPGGVMGWAIVSAAVVVNVGLFAASLVFLASGQSFEQFRGIE